MNTQNKQSLFMRELNLALKGSGGKVKLDDKEDGVFLIVCSSRLFRSTQLNPSDFLIMKIGMIGKRYFRTEPSFNNTRTCFWFN